MKLKKEYVMQSFRGENLIVAVGKEAKRFHGIARVNNTAAFIVECLRRDTDEAAIVEALLREFDVDETTALADVKRTVAELRSIGAIKE